MKEENNNIKKYDANFTAGGLLQNEFDALKEYLCLVDFEGVVRNDIQENKILGIKTLSARKRIVSELLRRYKILPLKFWEFFQNLEAKESLLALLYVCLKTYPIVFDLHFNVTVKKYATGQLLNEFDIQMRLDELATISTDVESWSDSTIGKVNTQYRKAITDSGLLVKGNLNKPQWVSDVFWEFFKENNETWFLKACFIN